MSYPVQMSNINIHGHLIRTHLTSTCEVTRCLSISACQAVAIRWTSGSRRRRMMPPAAARRQPQAPPPVSLTAVPFQR